MNIAKWRSKINWQIVRYGIIGGLTQLIDFSTYALLVNLGVHYVLADLLNNPISLSFNYLGHKYFTFRSKQWKQVELGKYLINLIINYFYSTLVLIIATDLLQTGPIWGKIIQIIAIPLINFLSLKLFVFKK